MDSNSIKLLTFNISLVPFWMSPYLRAHNFSLQPEVISADIINLQEVHSYDMLWYLQKLLTGFPYISYKRGLVGPKAGLVTFSKESIISNIFESLSFHRGVLISKLKSGVMIANVHLIANTDGDWSKDNRFYVRHKIQLDELNEMLNKLNLSQHIILSGDFNLAKSSDLYNYFLKKGAWKDAMPLDFEATFHAEFLAHDRKPQRVDYILIKGDFKVLSTLLLFDSKVKNIYLSNHLALSVIVKLLQ